MASTLKVQNIAHTGGTTGMTIDSSGRVTTSTNRPAFMARRTSGQSSGIVVFDTVMLNQGSHYDNSNGRFTAPLAGLYNFSFNVLSDNDGTDGYWTTSLFINGSDYCKVQNYTYSDNDYGGSLSVIASLSASDYVQVNNAAINVYGTSSATQNFTWFCGYLIG